ncbi:hypothetical protein P9112_004035 [Eukaryota sp. TZLM1-RC]
MDTLNDVLSSLTSITVQVSVSDDLLSSTGFSSCHDFINHLQAFSLVKCPNQIIILDNVPVSIGSIRLRFVPSTSALCTLPRPEALKSIIHSQCSLVPPLPSVSLTPSQIHSSISSLSPPFTPSSPRSAPYFATPWASSLFKDILTLSPSTPSTIGNGNGDGLPVVALNCCSIGSSDPIQWFASKFSASPSASVYALFATSHQSSSQSNSLDLIESQMHKSLGKDRCILCKEYSNTVFSNLVKRVASLASSVVISKILDTLSTVESLPKSKRWFKSFMSKDKEDNCLVADNEALIGDLLLQLGLYSNAITYLKSSLAGKKANEDWFACALLAEGLGKAFYLQCASGSLEKSIEWFRKCICYHSRFLNTNSVDSTCRWLYVKNLMILAHLFYIKGNTSPPVGQKLTSSGQNDTSSLLLTLIDFISVKSLNNTEHTISLLTKAVFSESLSIFLSESKPRTSLLYKSLASDLYTKAAQAGIKPFGGHTLRLIGYELTVDRSPSIIASLQWVKNGISAGRMLDRHGDCVILLGIAINSFSFSKKLLSDGLLYLLINILGVFGGGYGFSVESCVHGVELPKIFRCFVNSERELSMIPSELSCLNNQVTKHFGNSDFNAQEISYALGEDVFFDIILTNPIDANLLVKEMYLLLSVDGQEVKIKVDDVISDSFCFVFDRQRSTVKDFILEPLKESSISFKLTNVTDKLCITFNSVVFGLSPVFKSKSNLSNDSPEVYFSQSLSGFIGDVVFNSSCPLLSLNLCNLKQEVFINELTSFELEICNYGREQAHNVSLWVSDPSVVYFELTDSQKSSGMEGSDRLLKHQDQTHFLPVSPEVQRFPDCELFSSPFSHVQVIDNFQAASTQCPNPELPSLVIPSIQCNQSITIKGWVRVGQDSKVSHVSPFKSLIGFSLGCLDSDCKVFNVFQWVTVLPSFSFSFSKYFSMAEASLCNLCLEGFNLHCSEGQFNSLSIISKSHVLNSFNINSQSSSSPFLDLNSGCKFNKMFTTNVIESGSFHPSRILKKSTSKLIVSSTDRVSLSPALIYFLSFELLIIQSPGFHPRSDVVKQSFSQTSISPTEAFAVQKAQEELMRLNLLDKLKWPHFSNVALIEWSIGNSIGYSFNFNLDLFDLNYIYSGMKGPSRVEPFCWFSIVISVYSTCNHPLPASARLANSDQICWKSSEVKTTMEPFTSHSITLELCLLVKGMVAVPFVDFEFGDDVNLKVCKGEQYLVLSQNQ